MTASWCPVHGDCTCPGPVGSSDSCPLHGPDSDHAETIAIPRTQVRAWRAWFEEGGRCSTAAELALYAAVVRAEAEA